MRPSVDLLAFQLVIKSKPTEQGDTNDDDDDDHE